MIKLPGQLAAYQEVSIFPKVNGYVKDVKVDIGSHVKKGQLLMTLEAPELEQSTMQAKEKYARTKADLSIDREHYNRLLEASQTPGAISPLDLSFVKSKMESDSAVSNAAKSNWQMQQTMEAYLVVTAPFNGVITDTECTSRRTGECRIERCQTDAGIKRNSPSPFAGGYSGKSVWEP